VSALLVGAAIVAFPEPTSGRVYTAPRKARTTPLPGGYFSDLRVCAYQAFSKALKICTRDERNVVLVSSRVACSVSLVVEQPGIFTAQMTYDGSTVYSYRLSLLPGVHHPWVDENVGNVPLPGGEWGCVFSFEQATAQASFMSGGTTGSVLGVSVCLASDTVTWGTRHLACRSDESSKPLPPTDAIACSALFVQQLGRRLQVLLLTPGPDRVAPAILTIDQSIWSAWPTFRPATSGSTFPAGTYVCRFSLDGVVVAEKPFSIAG
jgi:hypothetical protein